MKSKSILFVSQLLVAALMTVCNATAQSTTYEATHNLAIKNSIIRIVDDNYRVEYIEYVTGNSTFGYIEPAVLSSRTTHLPHGIHITDMEVVNTKRVFFCGYIEIVQGVTNGIVGYFDISDLLSGTGLIHFYFTPVANAHVSKFLQMDTYNVGNETHIVATANIVDTTLPLDYRALFDINFDFSTSATPNPSSNYIYEIGAVDYFEDVAEGRLYIATVENKHNGNGQYIRVFDKPSTSSSNCFSTSTYYNYYSFASIDAEPESNGPLRITTVYGNRMATICYAKRWNSGSTTDGVFIFVFDCTPTGPVHVDNCFITLPNHYDTTCTIDGFAYDTKFQSFYFSLTKASLNAPSDLWCVPYGASLTGTAYRLPTNETIHSIDDYNPALRHYMGTRFAANNIQSFTLINNPLSSHCLRHIPYPTITIPNPGLVAVAHLPLLPLGLQPMPHNINTTPIPISIFCR